MQVSPVLLHNKKAIGLGSHCYLQFQDHPEFLQPLAPLRRKVKLTAIWQFRYDISQVRTFTQL